MPVEHIIWFLNKNFDMFLEKFSQDEIERYRNIKQQFERLKGAVGNNRDFQTDFINFYDLKFYQKGDQEEKSLDVYFNLLSNGSLQNRITQFRDLNGFKEIFHSVFDQIEEISNKNVFSYTTKLIHTINPIFPIYDVNVRVALDLEEIYDFQRNKKDASWSHYNQLLEIYKQALVNVDFNKILNRIEKTRDILFLSNLRKIDFIVWCMGKVIEKVRKMNQFREGRVR